MASANIDATIIQTSLIDSGALRSFCIAVRACSLVILIMLGLVFITLLFAIRPAFLQQVRGEVFVSSDRGLTVQASGPDKLSCLTGAGENWKLDRDLLRSSRPGWIT